MQYIAHTNTLRVHEGAEDALSTYIEVLKAVVDDRNMSVPECALVMPYLNHSTECARARAYLGDVEYLFVVGIGGSSLGIEALYGVAQDTTKARLIVLDTVAPLHIARALRTLDASGATLEDIGVVVISKSGSTTETMANATLLISALSERFDASVEKRVVVVTDANSALDMQAAEAGYPVFHIPTPLGGRYSVCSSVGIIPAALLGLDVDAFLTGAQEAITSSLEDGEVASAARLLASKGRGDVVDTFVFATDLEPYAKWRRQLIAESLGKSQSFTQATQMFGPLPTVSTAADLHSVAQLYLSGERGIHTDFVTCAAEGTAVIPHLFSGMVPHLAGKTTADIDEALTYGVLAAYTGQGLSHAEYRLTACTLHELGALMARNMLEVMLAAEVIGIDAFNQPEVELYKQKMREKLSRDIT
jgi:glucose-6-phosphate isomerase